MREFGDANWFEVYIGQSQPDPDYFSIQMRRADVEIFGGNHPDSGPSDIKYGIGFYSTSGVLVRPELIDELVSSLQEMLLATPGVISIEKR